MPPKRKAAGGGEPSPARKKAAATAPPAAPPEEVTTVTLFEFDKRWHGPLLEMFQGREQTDVVVSAGDHSVGAHRILLSAISPYFRAQFSGKFEADSQSREFRLQELSGPGVAAVVEFAYTGKVDLSGSTVVGIIRAANRLQVEVVEQAAVDFLVAGLDPGNVLDAMALGAHLSAGSIGRDLEAKSRAYVCGNFPAVSAEQTFLALPVAEVAALVGSDDIAAAEEEVFAGVVRWVKEDEAGRKEALGQWSASRGWRRGCRPWRSRCSPSIVFSASSWGSACQSTRRRSRLLAARG